MITEINRERFLQLIIDNIPSYVFWKDINSVYLGCNKVFSISAGLNSTDEIINKTDYDPPWSKEDADFYRKIDKEVMDSGEAQINFEEPQNAADNKKKWLRTSKIPLFNEEEKVIGILGTYEDITLKKEMELSLKKQAKQLGLKNKKLKATNFKLEQANLDLEHFAFATSHDLQEPLRMMGSFSDLLAIKYSKQLGTEGISYLNFIKEGSVRMSSLVNGVLSYSMLNEDWQKSQMVNLNEIVAQVIKYLDSLIVNSKAVLEINLPSQKIECQGQRIGLLFSNLITNGIKFNHSQQPLIKINFEEKKKAWLFSVEDNGIGIDNQFEVDVFQPFKRLNNRRAFSGNGIGLSICKRIVHLQGGEIWFKPNSLGGTRFFFTLKK